MSATAESAANVRISMDIVFSGGWSIIYLASRVTSQETNRLTPSSATELL
jgi:hypothetical protein